MGTRFLIAMLASLLLLPSCGGKGSSSDNSTNPPTTTVPAIAASGQPQNQTVIAGQTATFTVTAMGTAPLGYQWKKDGAAIGGAAGASYTTPVTTTADSGSSFTVTVSNSAGNITSRAATLTVNPINTSDTTAPTIPTNLATTAVSATQINLTWTASTDDTAVTGYRIYRDGSQINTSSTTSYSDTGLTASTTYSYTVAAYDASANVSAQCAAVSGTTLAVSTGNTYYIDPTYGNDDNNTGLSTLSAWRTFRNIFTYRGDRRPSYGRVLAGGDTLYVMNGTISDVHRPGDDNGAADVTGSPSIMRIDGDDMTANGSETAPIRILAYPGHHPLIDANYQGDGIAIEHASWIEIAGINIRRAYGAGIGTGGADHITIHDCEIYDGSGIDNNNMSGLLSGSSSDIEVYNCSFHDNYDRDGADTGGISTWNSTNMVFFSCTGSIKIHDCLIYQTPAANSVTNSGGGIKYKHSTPSNVSTFEVYRNVFRNCKFFSFQSGSANTHFHHNIIIGGNTGISSEDCGGPTHQTNQVFEYNTIYRTFTEGNASVSAPAFSYYPTIAWRNTEFPTDPQDVIFRNNIVYDTGTYTSENSPITVYPYISDDLYNITIPELFIDRNCYYNASGTALQFSAASSTGYGGPLYGGVYDWTQWRALTWTDPATSVVHALGYDQNSINANPQFTTTDEQLGHFDPDSTAFRPANISASAMGAYAALPASISVK